MAFSRIVLEHDISKEQLESLLELDSSSTSPERDAQRLASYIRGLASGAHSSGANLSLKLGSVKATGTITSTGTATAAQTMKLANQTLTAKASGAVPADGEFDVSATPGTQAANIALAINSMPELSGIVTAEANAGVVTVTAVVPGLLGNGIEMADVDLGNVTVAGFSGGTDGDSYSIDLE